MSYALVITLEVNLLQRERERERESRKVSLVSTYSWANNSM
jgi:hypothetical protein